MTRDAGRQDMSMPADIGDGLLQAIEPVMPAPQAAQSLRGRILHRARQEANPPGAPLITIRSDTPGWAELLPKVHAKLLFTDGVAQSYLVRLEPGAHAPAHPHPAEEECLVLEGELRIGDIHLRAGDFHVAGADAEHGETVSETGALLFLRYARPLSQYIHL